jgi:hypothetical protein
MLILMIIYSARNNSAEHGEDAGFICHQIATNSDLEE